MTHPALSTLELVTGFLAEDDPFALAARVIGEAAASCGAEGGSIFLPGDDDTIALDVVWSKEEGARTGRRLALGEGIAGWVALHGETLLLNDAPRDSRFAEFGGRTAIGSLIAVPLELGARRGVLALHAGEVGAFTPDDRDIVKHFGSLACLIFRRVMEKRVLEEMNRDLARSDERLIREISHVHLAMSMSRNVLAQSGFENQIVSICHQLREQFELSGVAIFLVNSDSSRLQGIESDGFPGVNVAAMDYQINSDLGSRNSELAEDVARAALVRAAALAETSRFSILSNGADHEEDEWSHPGEYACIPLRVHGRTFGVIVLAVCDPAKRLLDEVLATLEAFVDLVSLAILQARTSGEAREAYLEILSTLANVVELRDTYTGMHTENVMAYSVALGRAVGCSPKDIDDIRLGAILHDIGKIAILDRVLQKPGGLLPWEYEEMKTHVEHGSNIITTAHLLKGAYQIVRHHHERWDGAGYPDRLGGGDIPLPAQIVAIADAYDAMVTDRPYRRGMTPAQAVEELRKGSGTQFNPELVEIFVRTLGFEADETSVVTRTEDTGALWLALDGTLTLHAGRQLLSAAVEWITPARNHVVVNLLGARDIIESGMWSLVRISSKCRAVEGFLIILATGRLKVRIIQSSQGMPFRVMEDIERAQALLRSYREEEQPCLEPEVDKAFPPITITTNEDLTFCR